MNSPKSTSPCPSETKSQPRRSSPNGEVRAENAPPPVQPALRVLEVDVEQPLGKRRGEFGRVDELMDEMARVEVEAEARVAVDGRQGCRGGRDVVGDLPRMHLEAEPDALAAEDVEDRLPAVGELVVAARRRRPSRSAGTSRSRCQMHRAGEAVDTARRRTARRRARCPGGRSAARRRTPAGSPSPRSPAGGSRGGGRRSRSQVACPTRCAEIAWQRRSCRSSSSRVRAQYPGSASARRGRRSGRPSRRARGRRSPTRRRARTDARAAGRPTGR